MDTRKFFIKPQIPDKLIELHELAFNMWTCWDKDAEKLFHRLDPQLFRSLSHNPVEMLYRMDPQRLKDAAKDKGFLYELKQAYEKFKAYMSYEGTHSVGGEDKVFLKDDGVVYICMEYGLHESLPVYSGGLAVLAGDQLKAASDIGIPMVSFGLLYRYGYFNQHITPDGNQMEEFRENTWYLSPVTEVIDEAGIPLLIEIPLKDERVFAKIWKIQVGKVPLYLLDTNVHQNPPKFRKITNMLYDSDRRMRLEQELILGRGTVIALRALGIAPRVYHLNEGHTAFSILERLIELVNARGHTLEDAKNIIRYSTVFTTHTPVIEGNEHFLDDLIHEYLEEDVKLLGMTMDDFLSLGKIRTEKMFWLPALALRFSRHSNGVSKIHSLVSKNMWRGLFPTMNEKELPISGITNGVHLQSWLSLQMTDLFDRYIGPDYTHKAEQSEVWEKVNSIPDSEIWNAHRRRKEQVISFIRRRVSRMMMERGYGKRKITNVERVLNPDYLTIGFARRFAPYKRANLILNNPERLVSILTNEDRPVQLVFAGKAHPADSAGKDLIRHLFSFINSYPIEDRVVFVEDYDINVARHLVQGVDVWLNTPLKPMEASGTSGMKAGINGVLNLSVLDGWWPEAYNGENGWAIAVGGSSSDSNIATEAEADQLYDLLENEVAETFYNREEGDIPLGWVKMMKNSIITVCREFNMHRTLRQYIDKFYFPQMEMSKKLVDSDFALLKKIADGKKMMDSIWPNVYVKDYFTSVNGKMPVSGDDVNVECYVYLADADEKLISVEVFYSFGEDVEQYEKVILNFVEKYQDKVGKFIGKINLKGIGLQEISIRLVPSDPILREVYPEYAKWKE